MAKKLVGRHKRVAFMKTAEGTYTRMTGFTQMTNNKNPQEYSRHYIDEQSERSDVVGYAPSIDYSFDRHTETAVHDIIAEIHDNELIGNDAHVEILVVDLFTANSAGKCDAILRTYAVIPNNDGDGNDALIYTGSFKSVSDIKGRYATVSEDGQTAEDSGVREISKSEEE